MHTLPNDWNPSEYLAWFLKFHEALPTALGSNLSGPVYDAVAYMLANPTPVASHEYMKAMVDTHIVRGYASGISLTAINQISPEISAWTLAYWGEMKNPASIHTSTEAKVSAAIHQPEQVELIGYSQHLDQWTHYA